MTDEKHPPSGDDGPALPADVEDVYAALEEGEILDGLELALALEARHPQNGEVALAHAAAAHQAGLSRESLDAARRAATLGCESPSLQLFYEAAGLFRLWQFKDADEITSKLVSEVPDFADAWYLFAQIHEFLGDEIGARRGYRQATALAGETFPMPTRIVEEYMSQLIERAVGDLPAEFQNALKEVSIVVRPLPEWEMVKPHLEQEDPFPPDLLGLFVGQSRLDQSVFNAVEEPGVVFLFRKNLERISLDPTSLEEEIRLTVWHELAHYLGFTEDDMEELGLE